MTVALQPVSLGKGRPAAKPRLKPYLVPSDQIRRRNFTAEEDAVIRANYPGGGMAACHPKLPGRTISGIYQRARKLGLNRYCQERTIYATPELTPELEADIRAAWPTLSGRGMTTDLAHRLKIPRRWLLSTALRLGLEIPNRKKEPPWSEAENRLLAKIPLHDLDAAAKAFRARGFRRTPTAIASQCRRLEISRRYAEAFSATRAAKVLGVDMSFIKRRCINGAIVATRRQTDRLPQQGGDPWDIKPADLRRFIVDHLDQVDIRKVDKFAFVALLTAKEGDDR